ncbi:MAG: dicarboxylate/amino acid:cation symporter [Pseudomonadales bacterium]|jgi:Na+/H+-dicarboxylate symporter|nr:dicarboxylate/amino acid:cation symporter [Pseudomonadales bacterium]MBP6228580.1 dicarboxylate/amino acid:cation symporter [Pseudomonadales bacterium]
MNMKLALHWQICIAILLAGVAGYFGGPDWRLLGVPAYGVYEFLGTLFMNGLRMIIVPLVVSTIITGIAGIGNEAGFARLGIKTILYYLATSLAAVLIGLVLVNWLQPGLAGGGELAALQNHAGLEGALGTIEGRGAGDLVDVFLRMVPANVFQAAANDQMLGLIFFSLMFGYFMMRIGDGNAELMRGFWQGVSDTMMSLTMWIMKFAPLGVFGLVAKTVADTGFAAFEPLLLFVVTVLLGFAFHVCVTIALLVKVLGKTDPVAFYRAIAPAMLTAFSTASSSATVPVSLECIEKNVGVSNRIGSFVIPLGATVNMNGTALYECVAAIFIAQAYGIHLDFTTQFTVVVLALMTSIGVAGIPAASLVAISIILNAVGLPLEGIGMLLVTDRVLDMLRTSINVLGDCSGAVVVSTLEGERNRLRSQAAAEPGPS